jgi:hypothetical protein
MHSKQQILCVDANSLQENCTAWLWCTDARGCTVSGGRQLQSQGCALWRLDMLPLARPDSDVPPDAAGRDMYNHTVGFLSGRYTTTYELPLMPIGQHL